MDPNQPILTNPIPSSGPVDPNQTSGTIEFPAITPAESPQPAPEPTPPAPTTDFAASQPAPIAPVESFSSPASVASNINPTPPTTENLAPTPAPIPPAPVATQPITSIGNKLLPKLSRLPKIPFKAAVIGLVVLVILIVVLSLTLSNSSKPTTTNSVNSGTVNQPTP